MNTSPNLLNFRNKTEEVFFKTTTEVPPGSTPLLCYAWNGPEQECLFWNILQQLFQSICLCTQALRK